MKWLCSLFYSIDFCTKTGTSDKIKYLRLSKNTKIQQENTPRIKKFQLKTTGINWEKGGIGEKGFPDNSEGLQKTVKTFLNNEQIQFL